MQEVVAEISTVAMKEGAVLQNIVTTSRVSDTEDEAVDGKAEFFRAWYKSDGVNNATCILITMTTEGLGTRAPILPWRR